MLSKISKRSTVAKEDNEQRVPFSPELKDFIKESRENQTLCSTKLFGVKVFQYEQANSLQEFIAHEMFSEKLINKTKKLNKNEEETVLGLSKEIIAISKLLNKMEIHVTIIWVYYFSYDENKSSCLPVFKIFKELKDSGAIFLDPSLRQYDSWDHFLENADIPDVFLCLPRHGEYKFHKGQLELEFVLSKSLRSNLDSRNSMTSFHFKMLKFSHTVVYIWKNNVKNIFRGKDFLDCCKILLIIIVVFSCIFKFSALWEQLPMFLLSLGYLDRSTCQKVFVEGMTLIRALRDSERNWIKIFESVSILTKYLRELSEGFQKGTKFTKKFMTLTSILQERLQDFFDGNHGKLRAVSDDKSSLVKNFESPVNKWSFKALPQVPSKLKKTAEFKQKIPENLSSDSSLLETTILNEIEKLTLVNHRYDLENEMEGCSSTRDDFVFPKEIEKYNFYFLLTANIPELVKSGFLRNLELKAEELGKYDVIDSQGVIAGKIFTIGIFGVCFLSNEETGSGREISK